MNARQLEVFRAIMRNASLTAAAQSLNVSQPAVSKILRHFESQLGYALFERVGGRLMPTMEARLLYDDADRVFREIEVLRQLAVRIKQNRVGILSVGASAPLAFGVLPKAMERFQARRPEVKFVIRMIAATELSEKIFLGELDLGLALSAMGTPGEQAEVLGTTEVVVVMPQASPLAAHTVLTPTDLAGERLISYGSHADIGALLDASFERAGTKREVAIEIALSVTALPLVQAGLGIAVVDGLVPWKDFPGLVVRPFLPRVLMSLYLVTNGNRPTSRLVQDFAQDVRAVLPPMNRVA